MFICTKCGMCCRNIDLIPELKEYDIGNGTCVYLSENNLCTIYDDRPEICNVDKMFEKKYKMIMTREEYEKINEEGCKALLERHR